MGSRPWWLLMGAFPLRARIRLVVQGLEGGDHARRKGVLGRGVLTGVRALRRSDQLVARLVVLVERALVAGRVGHLAGLFVERLVLERGVGRLEVTSEHARGELREVLPDRVLALGAVRAGWDIPRIVAPGVDGARALAVHAAIEARVERREHGVPCHARAVLLVRGADARDFPDGRVVLAFGR